MNQPPAAETKRGTETERGSGAYRPGLARFAWVTAASTFLVLLAGASVTSTGSGLSVPDWPLSYGKLFPPMTGGILFEHGHRMVAGAVLLLVLALTVWVWRVPVRRSLRCVATTALILVVAQAVLGGLTVLWLLPPLISVAHAATAMVVFGLVVTVAALCSRGWVTDGAPGAASLRGVGGWGAAVTGIVFLQIFVGAVMRHIGAGLACPEFPLCHGAWIPPLDSFFVAVHFYHRAGGVVVALAVWALAAVAWRSGTGEAGIRRLALLASIWVALQFLLGVLSIWTRLSPAITVLHHGGGAFLLALTLLLTLWSYRRSAPWVDAPAAHPSAAPLPVSP